jgi:hypothetical protein
MLPDFRFLFAAIVLSMSILVFGLGAAALLRAAHEEFASTPAWHPPQETVFAQQPETTGPVLAMLRLDAPVAEQKSPNDVSPAATPTQQPAIISTATETERTADTERTAARQPQDALPSETAKPDVPVAESPAQDAATPPAVSPAAAGETKIAASEKTLPAASEAVPAAPEQANTPTPTDLPTPTDANIAATKTAALDSPAVTIEAQPAAKPAVAKHDKNAIKKARRANRNRRLALRARLAQQAPQQLTDPFGQPMPMVAPRRR